MSSTPNPSFHPTPAGGKLERAMRVITTLGPKWAAFRAWYSVRQRLGWLRRSMPCQSWKEAPLRHWLPGAQSSLGQAWLDAPPAFLFDEDISQHQSAFRNWADLAQGPEWRRSAIEEVKETSAGVWRIFGDRVQGEFPPDWHQDPTTGERYNNQHWSQIREFRRGDIKRLWEPARFTTVFGMVRAASQMTEPCHSSDEPAELFWSMFESFHRHNPPNHGPHWKCGQEAAMRLMACCFGLYGFRDHQATTPERVDMVAQLAAATADRITGNIQYALHQYNNHGISEAAGLFTAGLLFPQLQSSRRWVRLGKQLLERQVRDLVYDDGAFSQHSANYHRLMLQLMLWSVRLGDMHDEPLSIEAQDRIRQSVQFLWQLQDETTGWMPNYGQNDGALLLPLSNCPYRDFRPVLQAASVILNGERLYESGPWDEETVWMTGETPPATNGRLPQRREFQGSEGGCHTLRSETGMAAIRCTEKYIHRPGHSDTLHVDLWWRGVNIALDPGTFSYNSPAPWDHPLACSTFHNTVTVDNREPMDRTSRFLFTPWISGSTNEHRHDEQVSLWEGSHDGYRPKRSLMGRWRGGSRPAHSAQPSVGHRRAVAQLGDEHWLVIDDLRSSDTRPFRLHWLFCDAPYDWDEPAQTLTLQTPAGPYAVWVAAHCPSSGRATSLTPSEPLAVNMDIVRADPETPRGWEAPSYGQRRPAISLQTQCLASHVRFLTLLGPPPAKCRITSGRPEIVTIETQNSVFDVELCNPSDTPDARQDRTNQVASIIWRKQAPVAAAS